MPFFIQEQIALPVWSTNPADLSIPHPVIVYTRDLSQLVSDVPYRSVPTLWEARADAESYRVNGWDVRWRDRLRVLIVGTAEKSKVWNAVQHAWYAHHKLVINPLTDISKMIAEAARHYKVPALTFSYVIGGKVDAFCVQYADKIVSFGETRASQYARRWPEKIVHVL